MTESRQTDPLVDLNRYFDYVALHSEVTEETVRRLCAEAIEFQLFAVCVNPVWIKVSSECLAESDVRVVAAAAFPLGANRTDLKALEAAEAVQDGAHEIDVVANVGWLCSNRFIEAEAEIRKIRRNLPDGVVLKVIIEAARLTGVQVTESAKMVVNAGAQFVKTGTGFFGAATTEQVRTLRQASGGLVQVKAAGGIQTLEQCRDLIDAGATRLGSSSCVGIIREWKGPQL